MQADLYNNRLLKSVKQFFSCRTLYICIVHCISVYMLFLINPLLYSFLNVIGANRLGGEITRGRND